MIYYFSMKHTTCPIARVAELLSDTWTMLIIRDLLKHSMRFSELERSLAGISTRTLTLKLNRLVEKGIVEKTDEGYILTEHAQKLREVIDAMDRFGKAVF